MQSAEFIELMEGIADAYDSALTPLCRKYSLTNSALCILLYVRENPDACTAREIYRHRRIKPNLISVNVETLVGKGLLTRERQKSDRRKIYLSLTKEAEPILSEALAIHREVEEKILGGISPEERNAAEEFLRKMLANVQSFHRVTKVKQ